MSKGLLCHFVSVTYLDHDIPSIDLMPLTNEFRDVFSNDLSRVPPLERFTLVSA